MLPVPLILILICLILAALCYLRAAFPPVTPTRCNFQWLAAAFLVAALIVKCFG